MVPRKKAFRIYSLDFFKHWFTKAGYFNPAKYHSDIKKIQEEIWRFDLVPANEEDKKICEEQDLEKDFPQYIIERLIRPENRNLYFKFSEVWNALKDTRNEIEWGKEWILLAYTVWRMETLINTWSVEETLMDKFGECYTTKSDKLISNESTGTDKTSYKFLNSFGYRRTD